MPSRSVSLYFAPSPLRQPSLSSLLASLTSHRVGLNTGLHLARPLWQPDLERFRSVEKAERSREGYVEAGVFAFEY